MINYTYTTVSNPRYVNEERTLIDLDVNFDHLPEESVSFTADPNDIYPHSKELFDRAVAGDFGAVADYTPHVLIESDGD